MAYTVYVASQTDDGGILRFELTDDGKLVFKDKYDIPKPAYFCSEGRYLYALLREPFLYSSGLQKFEMKEDGSLAPVSGIESVHGTIAAHLCAVNGEVYVANYINGTAIKMPDRMLAFPGYSHPHCMTPTPDGKYICMTDLGTDTVYILTKDMSVRSSLNVTEKSGPRHIVFSACGKYAYCANQDNSTVSVLGYEDGKLEFIREYSTVPAGYTEKNEVSAIRLTDDGRKLYVSNRGHDSAAVFDVSGKELVLDRFISSGGTVPREMTLAGRYLLFGNIGSDNVAVYDLEKNEQVFSADVPQPWGIIVFEK